MRCLDDRDLDQLGAELLDDGVGEDFLGCDFFFVFPISSSNISQVENVNDRRP